eukprot:scaffold229426_cov24-Prasinocladus_malaysianus.AAC.1
MLRTAADKEYRESTIQFAYSYEVSLTCAWGVGASGTVLRYDAPIASSCEYPIRLRTAETRRTPRGIHPARIRQFVVLFCCWQPSPAAVLSRAIMSANRGARKDSSLHSWCDRHDNVYLYLPNIVGKPPWLFTQVLVRHMAQTARLGDD